MANTKITTPNTFTQGLVMDFNPTMTQNNVLVNALNATLLTFNGNEMQLQQDMGNGRVETAFLPQGYVPVGACEFGDIIYVVSYNPLEDKSQIGCFPSPERNITSEELTDMQQSLQASDFQEFGAGAAPTGRLKATSVKKIIYGNKNMNPGDKYVIYEESTAGSLAADGSLLSDYGNTGHRHDTWPKLVKLRIVSIEDSGRITDLGASVKWYDNDYYIASLQSSASTGRPDLDSYRSLVSSAYSIFRSKVSGKLAILAELEAVDGFSCTYDVYTSQGEQADGAGDSSTVYTVYFYTSWETGHNDINPTGFIITGSEWANGGTYRKPLWDGEKWSTEDVTCSLPAEAGYDPATMTYDHDAVKTYSRLYMLEEPSPDYRRYVEQDSYNARIGDILDWKYDRGAGRRTAVDSADPETLALLRPVTSLSRLADDSGRPGTGACYLYNVDSMEKTEEGTVYYTKTTGGDRVKLNPIELTDDVVNNSFHKDIPVMVSDSLSLVTKVTAGITVPGIDQEVMISRDTDLTGMIWNYRVAPVMPYGVLDWLEISGSIDFSKIGSGIGELTAWRYYNQGNLCTLTWGLDAYPAPNMGIAEIVFDFYDNQGFACSLHNTGKTSYSGTFTEQIVMGQPFASRKMSNIDAGGKTHLLHAGELNEEGTVYLTADNKPTDKAEEAYSSDTDGYLAGPRLNDVGALNPNALYFVVITVKYCSRNTLGEYNTDNTSSFRTFYRWLWTNGIFNEQYFTTNDFVDLIPQLYLDFSATFDTRESQWTNALTVTAFNYSNQGDLTSGSLPVETLGASVYCVNQAGKDDGRGNIRLSLDPVFAEHYSTFSLNEARLDLLEDVQVAFGQASVTLDPETPEYRYSKEARPGAGDNSLLPLYPDGPQLRSYLASGYRNLAGYICDGLGLSNVRPSDDFLAQVGRACQEEGLSFRTHTASQYVYSSAFVSRDAGNMDLWDPAGAAGHYMDSFSLNFATEGQTAQLQENFMYYDDDGNQQVIDKVPYITGDMNTAHSQGFRLVLSGIAFNKAYASTMKEGGEVTVYRPVLQYEKGEAYSAQMLGLHLDHQHLYFDTYVTVHPRKGGGNKGDIKVHGNIVRPEANKLASDDYSHYDWSDLNTSKKDWQTDATGKGLQAALQDASFPVKPCGMLGWGMTEDYTCRLNVCTTATTDGLNFRPIIDAFGYTSFSEPNWAMNTVNMNFQPSDDPSRWDDTSISNEAPLMLMLYDTTSQMWVLMNDWFYGKNTQDCYDARSGSWSSVCCSLGDMIGSLFIQLYIKSDDTSGIDPFMLPDNITSLKPYTEYWNQDIFVSVYTGSDTNPQLTSDNIRELVLLQGQTVSRYLECLKANSGEDITAVSSNNIDIVLNGVQRLIKFQYAVRNDNTGLLYQYQETPAAPVMIWNGRAVKYERTEAPGASSTGWYTYDEDNGVLVPFEGAGTIEYVQFFDNYGQHIRWSHSYNKEYISQECLRQLPNILSIEQGHVSWHDLDTLPKAKEKRRIHTRKRFCVTGLSAASFFNQYKVN